MKRCLLLLWLVYVVGVGSELRADELYKPLKISNSPEQPLQKNLYHFADTSGRVDILEAIKLKQTGQFRHTNNQTYRQNFGYNTVWHWWYFELEAGQQPADLILEIEYSNLDHVELFEVSNGQIRSLGITGDKYPFAQRPIVNNNYIFPVRQQAGRQSGYFLHIDQRHAILSFFIRLWQSRSFQEIDRREYLIWGIFVGFCLIVFFVNLVMLTTTQDLIFLWYNIYLFSITVHLLSDAGLGFQYLWPTFAVVNLYDPVYLWAWAAMIAQLTFMQYFIRQNRRNSRIFWWVMALKIVVTIALVVVLAIQVLDLPGKETYIYQISSSLTTYFVVGYIVVAWVSLWERRHEKNQLVRYYTYALWAQFSGYLFVIVLLTAQSKSWNLPFDVETYVIMMPTVLIDITFFSYGLAHRYNFFFRLNESLEIAIYQTRQEVSQKVIDTLEEERRRIAQDLHDDVGATLATAKGYLSTLVRVPALREKFKQFTESQRLLDQASEDLRTISHNLMPKGFSKIGLAKALEETVRKVSRQSNIDFAYVSIGREVKLSPTVEMQIFRIGTELVNNIQEHSEATEATIQLVYHADNLTLIAEDNGKGFNKTDKTQGKGIRNLNARAEFLQADITIDSNEMGTTVIVEVPLTKVSISQ